MRCCSPCHDDYERTLQQERAKIDTLADSLRKQVSVCSRAIQVHETYHPKALDKLHAHLASTLDELKTMSKDLSSVSDVETSRYQKQKRLKREQTMASLPQAAVAEAGSPSGAGAGAGADAGTGTGAVGIGTGTPVTVSRAPIDEMTSRRRRLSITTAASTPNEKPIGGNSTMSGVRNCAIYASRLLPNPPTSPVQLR